MFSCKDALIRDPKTPISRLYQNHESEGLVMNSFPQVQDGIEMDKGDDDLLIINEAEISEYEKLENLYLIGKC